MKFRDYLKDETVTTDIAQVDKKLTMTKQKKKKKKKKKIYSWITRRYD